VVWWGGEKESEGQCEVGEPAHEGGKVGGVEGGMEDVGRN